MSPNSKFCLINLILVINYIKNSDTYMVGNNPYHRREILDGDGKYQLEWLVDLSSKRVTFTVTAETNGAVGFGLSSNGKMTGADIVIGGVYPDGRSYFKDFHAVGNQMPEEDSSQDWTLISASEDGSFTVLTFSRKFDTCDYPNDYPINENKISIIWAYTEEDTPTTYHQLNRGEYQVYLIYPDYTPPIVQHPNVGARKRVEFFASSNSDLQTWTVTSRFKMPAEDTTYWCTMHKGPSLSRKHHIVGYEILFPSDQSRQHVHHLLMHKCHAPASGGPSSSEMYHPFLNQRGQLCYSVSAPSGPMMTQYCTEYYQAYGLGGRSYFYPPHVGVPFGESNDEYYLLQVHYDNPKRLSNVQVEVTIKSYYTSELRPNEAGIFALRYQIPGITPSLLIPPKTVDHQVWGLCGAECTRRTFPEDGIQIIGSVLHMHNTGVGMRVHHFRGNRELPWIRSDDNYGFDFQQLVTLHNEVRVLPGDMLALKCNYDNRKVNGTTVGGYSSQQEMCVAFFMYFNRLVNYTQCMSEIRSEGARERFLGIGNVTWSNRDLEYIVDQPDELAGLRVSQVSDNFVNWDSQRRLEYQQFILRESHVNSCPRELHSLPGLVGNRKESSGSEENDGEILRRVRFPFEIRPYKPPTSCSFQ